MVARLVEKTQLSAKGLIQIARGVFEKIKSPIKGNQGQKKTISLLDCITSALAIFKLKFPSLLQFDEARKENPIQHNLKTLFGLENVPSDTYMREKLDEVNPQDLRPTFTSIFAALQRGKVLERFVFLDNKYLVLSDGTGFFSSNKIHCANCCSKHHKNGGVSYYHQILSAVIAHPDLKEVIPLCPEPIMKSDGSTKNDCERNATERLLRDFRREHPHLPIILVEDALSSNGPHLLLLKKLEIDFITVVKPDGNKSLFEWIQSFDWGKDRAKWDKTQGEVFFIDKEEKTHRCRFVNNVPLNDTYKDLKVNFLEYWEIGKDGTELYHNTLITNITIIPNNAYKIARGGRARWHIENETFNTLKNQGYNFEHNYGHGNNYLSTVFAMLMMLAFLIDQAEQLSCGLFQSALKKLNSKKSRLWRVVRGLFEFYKISSWETLYRAIIQGSQSYAQSLDTS